jgi:hypothetical protein
VSPLIVGIEEPAAVEHADVGGPERLALHVPGASSPIEPKIATTRLPSVTGVRFRLARLRCAA